MKILIDERGKKYIPPEDKDFQSDLGMIKKEKIKKSIPGDKLLTHLGKEFKVIKANINDFIELMERKSSIILPKDIGTVIAYTGLGSGQRVLDAGTGSGSVAITLSNIVGDTGKVYTYEIREDFAALAKKNIEESGMKNITLKNKDIKEGIGEKNLDLIFLDLPRSWEIIENAKNALKDGGWIVFYTPYIEPIKIIHKKAKKCGFKEIKTLEVVTREIEVKRKGTRPRTRMIGHTGYLTFTRKI
ncbi:MAG TPA: tRNA (adenine-N1)-methyltransferase [Methanothermobacter sp.]|nr:protein-L-isoaspartate methyltransferase homolog [Methanothermobacter sp. MT-2]HHW05481.1 tRNA (adenine-N1)-methyltransferase [Methanothermobacter sp.]HOK72300.1 tRNA (adenine-N1)-methyltransferase [Methanothermobacter sp.]HOL68898.1 tRNA (adenine-N1)-methyltransferase [Methanothermobacter sp.]HPQ04963.1 tRNA (adenine-N1)-methyltransferase [Methanothermobacter sp.]